MAEILAPVRMASLLNTGDYIVTPAGRWEKVTVVDEGDSPETGTVRVCTDMTASGYGWRFRVSQELRYLPRPQLERRLVRVFEAAEQIVAAIAPAGVAVWPVDSSVLAVGRRAPGARWEVIHRPGGGQLEVATFDRRGFAVKAVRRAARAHARGLQLPMEGDT